MLIKSLAKLPVKPIVPASVPFVVASVCFDLRKILVLKAADYFRLGQDVALHRSLKVTLCSSRGKCRGPIQGIESEGITMNRPAGRAWTAVSNSPEII